MTASIESGLDFILLHFEEPTFPRRIATYATEGKQILVNNMEQALAKFKQSNLLDCRISAYPYPVAEYKGVNRQTPDFFLSDLDGVLIDSMPFAEVMKLAIKEETNHDIDKR